MRLPVVPNFTVTHFCGRGACGEVWRGVDARGVPRALKLMDLNDSAKTRIIQKENDAIVSYCNIAKHNQHLLDVFFVGRTGHYLYFVTELADNAAESDDDYIPDTLAGRLTRRDFAKEEIFAVTADILDGLSALHAQGLAHCDVKPENILFVNNQVRIADPGSICPCNEIPGSGTAGFHPSWRATADRHDIYAAGKVLYCMFSGKNADEFPSLPMRDNLMEFRELNGIVLNCCGETEKKGYKTLAELSSAIARLSSGNL